MVQTRDRVRIGELRRSSRFLGQFADDNHDRRVDDIPLRRACATPVPTTRARATALCCSAAIEVQESIESCVLRDDAFAARHCGLGIDHPIPDSLVRTLPVVVFRVFSERVPQRSRTDEDHPVETLALDRSHEPLRERVAIRRARRAGKRGWGRLLPITSFQPDRQSRSPSRPDRDDGRARPSRGARAVRCSSSPLR